MKRILKRKGQELYLDGFHLLALCQKIIKQSQESDADGQGTPANPYVMKTPQQWISRWRASSRESIVYYKLAGRLISKNNKLYVGDIGPAYLKGTSREDSVEKARAIFLKATRPDEGPYMAVANFNEEAKESWLKRNTIDDPTYRSGAQRIVDPGLIYESSAKTVEKLGGGRPAPWNDIASSPVIASTIRCLLSGTKIPLVFGNGKYDRNYSRKQFMLPVFTAAIFHAEPARNERAWPINLMLLDLAEAKTPGFTWESILWHPEAINPVANTKMDTPVIGPLGRNANERALVAIDNTDKLHLVGGILPASPTGGGERGKPSLYKEPKQLHPEAIKRGKVQGPGQLYNVDFDYIHQKEIDVLLTWLLRFVEIGSKWSLVGTPSSSSSSDQQWISPSDVLGCKSEDLRQISKKISDRCLSFEYMQ